MRIIKLGFISIIVFALLVTGMSLLLPSSVNISRAIDINAPVDSAYSYVADFTKWKHWYADSSETSFAGKAVGAGAVMTIGKSTVTFNEIKPTSMQALWQSTNMDLEGKFTFITTDKSPLCTVQWNFIHKVKWYPWEKFALIVSNKRIGPFMEKSLDNLKQKLEQQP